MLKNSRRILSLILCLFLLMIAEPAFAEENRTLDSFITDISVQINGQDYDGTQKVSSTTQFTFVITFEEDSYNQLSKVVTYDLPEGALVVAEERGILTDETGNKVADYVILDNQKVIIEFTSEFYAKMQLGNIEANFYFNASVNADKLGDGGKLVFNGGKTVTINLDTEPKLTINKYCYKSSGDGQAETVTYQIQVTAKNKAISDVVVNDVAGTGIDLSNATYSINYSSAGHNPTTGTITNGTINVGDLQADETATITYTVPITSVAVTELQKIDSNQRDSSVLSNTATATGTSDDTPVSSDPASSSLNNIAPDWNNAFNKWGEVSSDKSKITWTMKVNENQYQAVSVKGLTITDKLGSTEYTGDSTGTVIITRSDGQVIEVNCDKNGNWSYEFGSDKDHDFYLTGTEVYSYTITYTTVVDTNAVSAVWDNVEISNTGTLSNGASTTGKVGIGLGWQRPSKNVVSVDAETTTWQIVIHVLKDGMNPFFLEDYAHPQEGSNLLPIVGDIQSEVQVNGEAVDDLNVSVSYVTIKESDGETPLSKESEAYRFYFNGDSTTNSSLPAYTSDYDLVLTYTTKNVQADGTALNEGKQVGNRIDSKYFTDVNSVATLPKSPIFRKDRSYSEQVYDNDKDEWINLTAEDGEYWFFITINKDYDEITNFDFIVSDTFSSELNYVTGSACLKRYQDSNDWQGQSIAYIDPSSTSESDDQKTKTITFDLSGLLDSSSPHSKYKLFYKLKVDESVIMYYVNKN